jgi:hypothetical protein
MNTLQKIIAYPASICFTISLLILTIQLLSLYNAPSISGIFETAKLIFPTLTTAIVSLVALGIATLIGE